MAARQTRRQLQFSSFEAGVIGAVFAVTVSTVFFCGLFVGKRNAAMHAPAEDRVARVPVDDFTRYKRPAPLEKPVREPKPAATEAPVAVASASGSAPAPAAAAAPAAAKSPAGPAGPALPVGPAAPVPAAEAAARTGKPDPAAAAATAKDAADAAKAQGAAAKDAAAKETAAKEAAAKEAAAKKAAADKLAAEKAAKDAAKEKEAAESETGKGYTVQILATRKQAEADALVQKLKSRGYAAYIKRVSNGGEVYYRVRVGSYGAFSEAKGMADKCRRDMALGQAFVSTE